MTHAPRAPLVDTLAGLLALASTLTHACGAAVPAPEPVADAHGGAPGRATEGGEAPLPWAIGPFALTLPDGVRLSMDAEGHVSRDGVAVWRVEPDGRVEDGSGTTIAALLADGQISHRRELHRGRLSQIPSILDGAEQLVLREGSVDLLVLEEGTLRVAAHGGWPGGTCRLEAGAGSAGPLVVLVTLLDLLEHPRDARPGPPAARAPARLDANAAPASATRDP